MGSLTLCPGPGTASLAAVRESWNHKTFHNVTSFDIHLQKPDGPARRPVRWAYLSFCRSDPLNLIANCMPLIVFFISNYNNRKRKYNGRIEFPEVDIFYTLNRFRFKTTAKFLYSLVWLDWLNFLTEIKSWFKFQSFQTIKDETIRCTRVWYHDC